MEVGSAERRAVIWTPSQKIILNGCKFGLVVISVETYHKLSRPST